MNNKMAIVAASPLGITRAIQLVRGISQAATRRAKKIANARAWTGPSSRSRPNPTTPIAASRQAYPPIRRICGDTRSGVAYGSGSGGRTAALSALDLRAIAHLPIAATNSMNEPPRGSVTGAIVAVCHRQPSPPSHD